MKAYHGKQETKDFYIARVKKHRELDTLVQGTGWADGKGCAVGCTLESYDHAQYEKELGVPEWLARVEDAIFEGLPEEKALLWPERFMTAIHVGSDLERVKTPFLIFILENCLESLDKTEFDAVAFPDVKKAVDGSREAIIEMIRCHKQGLDLSAASSAAWSAANSAAVAARSAANSARSAAWSAAESAKAAAAAAESAAVAAESAAWSAAWSAANSAAEAAAYEKFADKLIELIEALVEEET